MIFFGKRVRHALYPDGDESVAEFDRLPHGKVLRIEATASRNIRHLRLFFALCQRIGAGIGQTTAWVERAFKIETGHCDIYSYGGQTVLELRSIAFAQMDDIAFREFFEACVRVAYERWQIDPASVADLLVPEEAHRRAA